MSIVVTGASGFLGSTLLPGLRDAGHRTVTIDRLPATSGHASRGHSAPGHAGPGHAAPDTTHLTCELTQANSDVRDALRDAEAVIHLAGCPGVRDSAADVDFRRQRDNVDAARAVLEATPLHTPVIMLSSSSVYGGARPDPRHPAQHVLPSHEEDVLIPRGGYAASKVAAEQVCRERAAAGGHIVVARPFTVLGEGQRADMAVARWAHEARATGGVTVLGSPTRTRDFTDVRDVARALIALVHSGATGTVNIGTGRGRSLSELAQAVCSAVGVPAYLHPVSAAPSEVAHTRANTARLLALTGFVPHTDLTDVVARSVNSVDRRNARSHSLVGV